MMKEICLVANVCHASNDNYTSSDDVSYATRLLCYTFVYAIFGSD